MRKINLLFYIVLFLIMFLNAPVSADVIVTGDTSPQSMQVIEPQYELFDSCNFLSSSPNLSPLPENYELHFVSGYEPQDMISKVVIDRPCKNIVLVLTAYDKIIWEVSATPKTKIVQIITNRANPFIKASKGIPLYVADLSSSSSTENINFFDSLKLLNKLLGITKVDSFYGRYKIDPYINISSISLDPKYSLGYPTVQKTPINIGFKLMSSDGILNWTPSGPVSLSVKKIYTPESYVTTPDGKYKFEQGTNSLIIKSMIDNSSREYPIPPNFPEFSWVTNPAYSPESKIVVIASAGAKGYFYRFNYNTKKWIDARPQGGADYSSLVYDPYTKHFLAFGTLRLSGNIIELALNGTPIKQYNIKNKLIGYSRLYDSENCASPELSIIPTQNHLILLTKNVHYIWVFDKSTGNAFLTYKKTK